MRSNLWVQSRMRMAEKTPSKVRHVCSIPPRRPCYVDLIAVMGQQRLPQGLSSKESACSPEKGMAAHSSILAWEKEEPSGLQSMDEAGLTRKFETSHVGGATCRTPQFHVPLLRRTRGPDPSSPSLHPPTTQLAPTITKDVSISSFFGK